MRPNFSSENIVIGSSETYRSNDLLDVTLVTYNLLKTHKNIYSNENWCPKIKKEEN